MTRGGEAEGASLGHHAKPSRHIPVLASEFLAALAPKDGEIYIDGTFGAGGYTRAILEAANCKVLALDQDPAAFFAGEALRREFGDRLTLISNSFSRMEREVGKIGLAAVDGVVLDIGVSSMQLDDPERGFSFMRDGPLDMRMSQEGPTAAAIVNSVKEEKLADIFYHLGEERRSRAIARAIVNARTSEPFATTKALVEVVERVLGKAHGNEKHPATRTFQALRIFVNDELGELARGLAAAERILKPGGRLVVVSFHSLEDRIVKRFLTVRSGKNSSPSRHLPEQSIKSEPPSFRIVNSRPLTPSKGELEVNPRARSARLRVALRTEAPAWPADLDTLGIPSP